LTSTDCAIKLGNETLPLSLLNKNLAMLATLICNKASHIWQMGSEWTFLRETAKEKN
jgi:hypothetical protein